MLRERHERNRLRQTIVDAERKKVISKEEVGFVVTLVEKFRADIEKKTKQLNLIQGEIGQLKLNEKIIMDLITNMVAAAERDEARRDTMAKLKGARIEEARFKEEQVDSENVDEEAVSEKVDEKKD